MVSPLYEEAPPQGRLQGPTQKNGTPKVEDRYRKYEVLGWSFCSFWVPCWQGLPRPPQRCPRASQGHPRGAPGFPQVRFWRSRRRPKGKGGIPKVDKLRGRPPTGTENNAAKGSNLVMDFLHFRSSFSPKKLHFGTHFGLGSYFWSTFLSHAGFWEALELKGAPKGVQP